MFYQFQKLTVDTPRNRMIRAALDRMTRLANSAYLARRGRALASSLTRADMALDQFGRNDAADRSMVALVLLAFDLALPTEASGPNALFSSDQKETCARRLLERAILGFVRVELEPLEWISHGGVQLHRQVSLKSTGIAAILPRMVTDIIPQAPACGRRLVVDSKFTSIFGVGRFGGTTLKSNHLYQTYAYVRSQEGLGQFGEQTDGLLLHPAIDAEVNKNADIQGHSITIATVNLSNSTSAIRSELRELFLDWSSNSASLRSSVSLSQ